MESEITTMGNQQTAASMLPPAMGSTNINVGPGERVLSAFIGAASLIYGLRNLTSVSGLSMLVTGGMLLNRGLSGYCMVNNAIGRNSNKVLGKTSAMEVHGSFMINKPRSEVYAFWRKLENLPMFMKHLESVTEEDRVNSTWKAKIPGNVGTVTWKAMITEDRFEELLSWTSVEGSTIDNAGEVRFDDAGGGSTNLTVSMTYRLPAGDVGSLAGKLFNPAVERMIKEDMRRFKTILENPLLKSSETESQPSASQGGSAGNVTGDTDADLAKPKRTRTRKTPDASSGSSGSRPRLKSSPSNDINQPTMDPERSSLTDE